MNGSKRIYGVEKTSRDTQIKFHGIVYRRNKKQVKRSDGHVYDSFICRANGCNVCIKNIVGTDQYFYANTRNTIHSCGQISNNNFGFTPQEGGNVNKPPTNPRLLNNHVNNVTFPNNLGNQNLQNHFNDLVSPPPSESNGNGNSNENHNERSYGFIFPNDENIGFEEEEEEEEVEEEVEELMDQRNNQVGSQTIFQDSIRIERVSPCQTNPEVTEEEIYIYLRIHPNIAMNHGKLTPTNEGIILRSGNVVETYPLLSGHYSNDRLGMSVIFRIKNESNLQGMVSLKLQLRSQQQHLFQVLESNNAFIFNNPRRSQTQSNRIFRRMNNNNNKNRNLIHEVFPNQGPQVGGNYVDLFVSVSRSFRYNQFTCSPDAFPQVFFGERESTFHVLTPMAYNSCQDVLNWLKDHKGLEMAQRCGQAQFRILVMAPDSPRPGLVDVVVFLTRSNQSHRLEMKNGYEYVNGDSFKKTKNETYYSLRSAGDDDDDEMSLLSSGDEGGQYYSNEKLPTNDYLEKMNRSDDRDYFGGSAYHYACARGDIETLRKILGEDGNPEVLGSEKDMFGITPLDVAHFHQKHEIIELYEELKNAWNREVEEEDDSDSGDDYEISKIPSNRRDARKKYFIIESLVIPHIPVFQTKRNVIQPIETLLSIVWDRNCQLTLQFVNETDRKLEIPLRMVDLKKSKFHDKKREITLLMMNRTNQSGGGGGGGETIRVRFVDSGGMRYFHFKNILLSLHSSLSSSDISELDEYQAHVDKFVDSLFSSSSSSSSLSSSATTTTTTTSTEEDYYKNLMILKIIKILIKKKKKVSFQTQQQQEEEGEEEEEENQQNQQLEELAKCNIIIEKQWFKWARNYRRRGIVLYKLGRYEEAAKDFSVAHSRYKHFHQMDEMLEMQFFRSLSLTHGQRKKKKKPSLSMMDEMLRYLGNASLEKQLEKTDLLIKYCQLMGKIGGNDVKRFIRSFIEKCERRYLWDEDLMYLELVSRYLTRKGYNSYTEQLGKEFRNEYLLKKEEGFEEKLKKFNGDYNIRLEKVNYEVFLQHQKILKKKKIKEENQEDREEFMNNRSRKDELLKHLDVMLNDLKNANGKTFFFVPVMNVYSVINKNKKRKKRKSCGDQDDEFSKLIFEDFEEVEDGELHHSFIFQNIRFDFMPNGVTKIGGWTGLADFARPLTAMGRDCPTILEIERFKKIMKSMAKMVVKYNVFGDYYLKNKERVGLLKTMEGSSGSNNNNNDSTTKKTSLDFVEDACRIVQASPSYKSSELFTKKMIQEIELQQQQQQHELFTPFLDLEFLKDLKWKENGWKSVTSSFPELLESGGGEKRVYLDTHENVLKLKSICSTNIPKFKSRHPGVFQVLKGRDRAMHIHNPSLKVCRGCMSNKKEQKRVFGSFDNFL